MIIHAKQYFLRLAAAVMAPVAAIWCYSGKRGKEILRSSFRNGSLILVTALFSAALFANNIHDYQQTIDDTGINYHSLRRI